MKARWQSHLQKALRTTEQLESFFQTSFPKLSYPVFIPLALAQKIKIQGLDGPLAQQFLPHANENSPIGLTDPIGDHLHSPVSQVVHRYDNRALFFPTTTCPVICRYCFRKNELYNQDQLFKPNGQQALDYLKNHPEIEEVIFSGGDPLMLSDKKLHELLNALAKIPHIRYLRFHTRFLTVLPERINAKFLRTLSRFRKRFSRISMVIHTNHRDEWSPAMEKKVKWMRAHHIDVYSQSVLLKGVNASPNALVDLFSHLACIGVVPYYLHHPDPAQGTEHFSLSIEEGRALYRAVKKRLSGWMVPEYVIELPKGGGKVSIFNSEDLEFKRLQRDKSS